MLYFTLYDICVGIDLIMPFRWLCFLEYLFPIVGRTDFLRLQKLELTICIKTFAPPPFKSRSENVLLSTY